jgi:hypothetical protein
VLGRKSYFDEALKYCPVTKKLNGVRPYDRKSTDVTIYDL